MKKKLALLLAFVLLFTTAFGSGSVVNAAEKDARGGVEEEEGNQSGITEVKLNTQLDEEGYYPASLEYVIYNFQLAITYADGETDYLRYWNEETEWDTQKEDFVPTGRYQSGDDSYPYYYRMAFYDAEGNWVKFSDDYVPIGTYKMKFFQKSWDDATYEAEIYSTDIKILDPTAVVKQPEGNTASFASNDKWPAKYTENWYPIASDQNGEYTYAGDFGTEHTSWFASIWCYKDGVATRINKGMEGNSYSANSSFIHNFENVENTYLVIGERYITASLSGSVTWNKKKEIASLDVNTASSYKIWNHDFNSVPVTVTYKDGSTETVNDWTYSYSLKNAEGIDSTVYVEGKTATTKNADVLYLGMKGSAGEYVDAFDYGKWKPGTYTWKVYVESDPTIYKEFDITVDNPDVKVMDVNNNKQEVFSINSENPDFYSFDLTDAGQKIEILNSTNAGMSFNLYYRTNADDAWNGKQFSSMNSNECRNLQLDAGYTYLIILETDNENSGTIGFYVPGSTSSAKISVSTVDIADANVWKTLPVTVNFVGEDGITPVGSQEINAWKMTGNPAYLYANTKYNEQIICVLYQGNTQVTMATSNSKLNQLLKEYYGIEDPSWLPSEELEIIKQEFIEMGYDLSESESSIPEGSYTLKIYNGIIDDSKLIGTKEIKVVNSNASVKVESAKLSATKLVYTAKVLKPTITIKDVNGNKLVSGTDYTSAIYNSSGTKVTSPKAVGKYTIKITYKGKYADNKATSLTYHIVPKAVTNLKAQLVPETGYNKIKVSWTKSTGATGYYVYYAKGTAAYSTKNRKAVTGATVTLSGLTAGAKYKIKVVPYYGSSKVVSTKYTETTKTTLKKVVGVKVTRSGKNVKVSWTNINGETGYQISRATTKTGTANIKTYSGVNLKNKSFTLSSAKKYYYKVRAYKTENGKKVYGPWSAVVYK